MLMQFERVEQLPATLVAGICDIARNGYNGGAIFHCVSIDGTSVHSTPFGGVSGGGSSIIRVADIPARDSLTMTTNGLVLVDDATGDANVIAGFATYLYSLSDNTWVRISEGESLDVTHAKVWDDTPEW